MADDRDDATDGPLISRYTGVVCRRCLTPVAHLLDDDRAHCPRCGYEWEVPPPVHLNAA